MNVQRSLSTFNTTTEMRPLSKARNPQLLPGRCSINGCPLLWVCVHGVCVFVHYSLLCVCTLDGLNAEHKFRVWVTILGHTPHVTSSFNSIYMFLSKIFVLFTILLAKTGTKKVPVFKNQDIFYSSIIVLLLFQE